jgi:mRNA interferase YafQ
MKLYWYKSFKRALKQLIHNNNRLEIKIFETLDVLSENPFDPRLRTHKLSGKLEGFWACSIDTTYRIIFSFDDSTLTGERSIVLVDIGTHDEVY